MSGRARRGIQSSKHRSASATNFSLHFNKADEDQIEITYADDSSKNKICCKSKIASSSSNECESSVLFDQNAVYTFDKTKENYPSLTSSVVSSDSANDVTSDTDLDYDLNKSALKSDETVKSEIQDNRNYSHCTKGSNLSEILCDVKFSSSQFVNNKYSLENKFENIKKESPLNDCYKDELDKVRSDIEKSDDLGENLIKSQPCSVKDISSNTAKETISVSDSWSFTCDLVKKIINFFDLSRNYFKLQILGAVLACILGPLPAWISGFFLGVIVSTCVMYWLCEPDKHVRPPSSIIRAPHQFRDTSLPNDGEIFKEWMNELPENLSYNPKRYHVSLTRSVYVRLDGCYLRLSFPHKNIPRRAMYNEQPTEVQFICQQHYDLTGANVELLPKGLSKTRLWSKKYPICLRIPNSKESFSPSFSKPQRLEENQGKKFIPRLNECNEVILYLFSRTDRDKHLWFSRFSKASKKKIKKQNDLFALQVLKPDSSIEKRAMSVDFATLQFNASADSEGLLLDEQFLDCDDFVKICLNKRERFEMYMSNLLASPNSTKTDKKQTQLCNLKWLNTFIGRFFFDFLMEDEWKKVVTQKIQKKLNKLKLPFFLTELTVKDIHLGSELPKIHQASDVLVDERGLWIYLDLTYNGSFQMTLETKLNLLRFQETSEEFWTTLSDSSKGGELGDFASKSSVFNSDEDSEDSFSDNDLESDASDAEGLTTVSKSGRLLKLVDRLAQSPYVKNATKNKYVKRAMDDLSKKPLLLTVEVQWLTGTLALNIPPWPSDRLWYGFQNNLSLSIAARPKLGDHTVTLRHVTEWIKKKLISEFQKVLVLPNMDDLIIPIMQSDFETEYSE